MTVVFNVKKLKKRRQYLRNKPTAAEKTLWPHIKQSQLGYKFRRQHSVNNYILDFYCPEVKLAIELEGEVHEFAAQKAHDRKRIKELNNHDIHVIRINDKEVFENIGKVLARIKKYCDSIKDK